MFSKTGYKFVVKATSLSGTLFDSELQYLKELVSEYSDRPIPLRE